MKIYVAKMSLVLLIIFSFGVSVFAVEEQSLDELIIQIREEVFAPQIGPMVYVPQIFVDFGDIEHESPEDIALPLPEIIDDYAIEPFFAPAPYTLGAMRYFSSITRNGHNQQATLSRQSARVNVWTTDPAVAAQVDAEMLARFDLIINRMEQSFAPFAGVRVITPWTATVLPLIGDIHGDGRVNLVLHNHMTSGGFFASGDFWREGRYSPIAAFHVNSNDMDNRNWFYGVVAHEFQHLLFFIHFGAYMLPQGSTVVSQDFLWLNESLSMLAGLLYANPDSETIIAYSNLRASENSYANPGDTRIGDFLNFNNSWKNYGMSKLHATLMHRYVSGYTRSVFDFFRQLVPLSTNNAEYWANHERLQELGMERIVGDAFHAAGLTGTTGAGGQAAFNALYFIFMENFAADGGTVGGRTTQPFFNSPYSAHRLWGIRPNLGINATTEWVDGAWGHGGVFPPAYVGIWWPLGARTPLPVRHTNTTFSLTGYNGTPSRGASHDRFYRLTGNRVGNDILDILYIQINDPSNNTRYYVAVPNEPPGSVSSSINRRFGQHGATVHPITANGTVNRIETGGQDAYLFIATLFRNVNNVRVEYSWRATIRTIIFHPNGGSGHMLAISQPNGTDFALPGWDAITLTRRNHGFTGWNTARDGSGQPFAPGDTIHNVTAHMTLFAQWGVSVLIEEPAPTWGRPARVRIPYRGVAEFELAVRGLPNREFDLECPQTPNYIEFTWPDDMPMEIVPTGILVPQGDGVHLGIVTLKVQR